MAVVYKISSIAGDSRGVVQAAARVEVEKAVGLEMEGLCVILREEDEGLVEGIRVAGEGEREVGEVVGVDLGFVRAWGGQFLEQTGDSIFLYLCSLPSCHLR